MPRGDGTGPMGLGPGTGRGVGWGRGQGRRCGFFGFFRKDPNPAPVTRAPVPEWVAPRAVPLAVVDFELCTGCGVCADTCGFSAIRMENQRPVVQPAQCTGCGACVNQCPKNAITLRER